ncbi:hypothetical protein [Streptomyces sp. NPDC047000]|uniref:hypothetical protein n=1 Tax=Streptomyces sp. NPDC047000 TaxID=3155474 RepID=UPI0033D81BB0
MSTTEVEIETSTTKARKNRAPRVPDGVVLSAARDCPGGRGPDGEAAETPPPVRLVDRTDSRERAVLMRAFSNANTRLTDDQPALGKACATVVRSAQRVERGIAAVDRFRRTEGVLPTAPDGAPPAAPTALRRTARPEPDSRTQDRTTATAHNPLRDTLLWRRLVWPVTAAAAVFDAAFVGSVIQQLLEAEKDEVQYWLAYLPGLATAVCLQAAGAFLAERTAAVRKARAAAATGDGDADGTAAAADRREARRRWRPLVAPWLFTLAVLGLIAGLGVVRVMMAVESSGDAYLTRYQPVIVLLLLLLSVAAVAAKLLAYDPEAAGAAAEDRRTKKAAKARKKHRKAADELSDEARKALVAHVAAWDALKAALDATEQGARRHVEDASTDLMEERARTGTAGTFDLPLRTVTWPPERTAKTPCAHRRLLAPVPPEGGPEIRLDLLTETWETLTAHHPAGLDRRLRKALADLDRPRNPRPGQPREAVPAPEPHPEPPLDPDPDPASASDPDPWQWPDEEAAG